ncbi:hypothetical protein [Micromonospora sp. DT31]|uniref:hypothetical protein n=1 Tax=Micromonospora sp. DT31 TaxID=3393434 RepID=UPI003CF120A1
MRTVVPPQFSGEDLQHLLAATLNDPSRPAGTSTERQTPVTPPPVRDPRPDAAGPAQPTDPWDEPW